MKLLFRFHSDGIAAAVTDGAVELYNPYNVALSLDDYKLYINATTQVDLTGHFIPPRGYFVLLEQSGVLSAKVSTDAQSLVSTTTPFDLTTTTGPIYLMRRFYDQTGALQYGAVDQYNATSLNAEPASVATTAGDYDFYVRRSNNDPLNTLGNDVLARWSAALYVPAVAEHPYRDQDPANAPGEMMTLGLTNNTEGTFSIPLYDHIISNPHSISVGPTFVATPTDLANIRDFNHIMRITNEIDMGSRALPAGSFILPATQAGDDGLISTPCHVDGGRSCD